MHQSKAKKIAISLLLTLAMLVSAQAAEISSLIPIGHTVGIQMSAEGVLVVQLDDVQTADGGRRGLPGAGGRHCGGRPDCQRERDRGQLQR